MIQLFMQCEPCTQLTPRRDLMRERTRSRIQDGRPQKRSANTVTFLPFNTDFSTRN